MRSTLRNVKHEICMGEENFEELGVKIHDFYFHIDYL